MLFFAAPCILNSVMAGEQTAIIQTGGKQYVVHAGAKLIVEKLDGKAGDEIIFDKVLLKGDDAKVEIGTPYLSGVRVTGTIAEQGRDEKKVIFRYHSKTRYRKLKGHRQPHTKVVITNI